MTTARRLAIPVPVLMLVLAAASAVSEAAAAPPGGRCPKPEVSADVVHPREKVSYDLEQRPGFRSAGRPLGWFTSGHQIRYDAEFQGQCLKSIAIRITVTPAIALRSIYKKKSKKCARQIVLAHEREHGRVARTQYKKFAASVEKMVRKLFTGEPVPDAETLGRRIQAKLDGGVTARFQKKLAAQQAAFHGKLAQAEIIKKRCRLVKRKRY